MKQVVVVKGCEGFADRLQSLSHCLQYCLQNNAAICVDWRDDLWGQQTRDFADYFEVVDVSYLTLNDVADMIKNNTSTTIFPAKWTLNDILAPPNKLTQLESYRFTFENTYALKEDVDIIVCNCKGTRMYHVDNLVCNLRLQKDIADIIIARLSNVTLPFTAVHLRGTDRLKESVFIEAAIKKYDALPEYARLRTYVFSDMIEVVKAWKEKYPETNVLFDNYSIYKIPFQKIGDNPIGVHQYDGIILNYYGVDKHDINMDTLTDFIVLCFAKWIVANNDSSVFTKMGSFIGNAGSYGISKWLHGFSPPISFFR